MNNIKIKLKVIEDEIINEYELIDKITDPTPGSLEIFIDEGPDLSVVKLFGQSFIKSLHMLSDNLGIPKKIIKITTENLTQDLSVWPNINILPTVEYFTGADRFEVPYQKAITHHFGLFVGVSRWHRLYLASALHNQHKEKTLMSYWQHHLHKDTSANLHMDDVLLIDANEKVRDNIIQFINCLPLHLNPKDFEPVFYTISRAQEIRQELLSGFRLEKKKKRNMRVTIRYFLTTVILNIALVTLL